ncbi:hypothetical protein H0H87_007457, partial [Tephrocybe sp. NHM501043]
SDKTVGAAGGWLLGGGHSVLSNTMGSGVDRVVSPIPPTPFAVHLIRLQIKVVTPDGQYRIANECQNEDLFALRRGSVILIRDCLFTETMFVGGGGTFGVVLEATSLASPPVALQTVIVSFTTANSTRTKDLWTTLTDNGLKWADEG